MSAQCPCCSCFLTSPPFPTSTSPFSKPLSTTTRPQRPLKTSKPFPTCTLSDPFPLPDLFQTPQPQFLPPPLPLAIYRADLLGSLFYTLGLYLGFSQTLQWGSSLRHYLSKHFNETISDATHILPFLMAGILVDGVIRGNAGGSWSLAGGVFVMLWGGVFEAGRSGSMLVREEDEDEWVLFCEFAKVRMRTRGRCHLIDVVRAYRDYRGGRLEVSQDLIRRFVRKWAPKARRSPNGFYRQLSVVPLEQVRRGKS